MAGLPIAAGIGAALSPSVDNLFKAREFKMRQEAQAMQLALQQQALENERERMGMEHQKFQAELPFLQNQGNRWTFEQLSKNNPDWMGQEGVQELASKLNYPMPQPNTNQPSLQQMATSGTYGNGVPISPNRRAAMMKDNLDLQKGKFAIDFLQNPSSFLDNLLGNKPPVANDNVTQGDNSGQAPISNSVTQPPAPPQQAAGQLPPPDKRVENQEYVSPNGVKMVWKKTPSGGFAFIPVAKPANEGPMQDPTFKARAGLQLASSLTGGLIPDLTKNMVPPGQSPDEVAKRKFAEKSVDAQFPSAVMQRGIKGLSSASQETDEAIKELEALFPGITKAATLMDAQKTSPSYMQWLRGQTVPYGDAASQAKAFNEWAKYKMGVPTPLANAIQLASFANLEQMSGQLPGVRGFQQILPLFHQHQSRFGFETPVQTVQRLMHMKQIMADTANELRQPEGPTLQPNQ